MSVKIFPRVSHEFTHDFAFTSAALNTPHRGVSLQHFRAVEIAVFLLYIETLFKGLSQSQAIELRNGGYIGVGGSWFDKKVKNRFFSSHFCLIFIIPICNWDEPCSCLCRKTATVLLDLVPVNVSKTLEDSLCLALQYNI